MKKKISSFINENSPVVFFSALIVFFSLFFTRYFIKMDDGNFMGIVSSPDFTYCNWLSERYMTLSGRTVGEFLMSFFLKQNIVIWQIINSLILIYIAVFWYRLALLFKGGFTNKDKQIFACCGIFLMFVMCLNPSVFWFAGSFTYLWPFAGYLLTISPLLFYVLDNKFNTISFVLTTITVVLATMQEQAAACTIATYLILIIITLCKRKFKAVTLLPLIPMIICSYHLLSSPGAHDRNLITVAEDFPRYADFGLTEKIFCGFATFSANTYFLSNFLTLLFIGFLSIFVYNLTKKHKGFLITINVFSVSVCIIANYLTAIFEKKLPHILFRECLISGKYNLSFYILILLSLILTFIITVLLAVLLLKNKKIGLIVCICAGAGFCSLLIMGLSSSVFISGQRTAFMTNMFLISCCVVLFSALEKNKLTINLFKVSIGYACVTFAIDCFAFKLFELPLMG